MKKISYQYSCNWTWGIGLERDSAFVNTNINIPHNLCGVVNVNWRLADWFSFFTTTVERQFNSFSSRLPPLRVYIFFVFSFNPPPKKERNLTPIYKRHRRFLHSCSTIWIYNFVWHLKSVSMDEEEAKHLNKMMLIFFNAKPSCPHVRLQKLWCDHQVQRGMNPRWHESTLAWMKCIQNWINKEISIYSFVWPAALNFFLFDAKNPEESASILEMFQYCFFLFNTWALGIADAVPSLIPVLFY